MEMKKNDTENWKKFFDDWEQMCEQQHTLKAEIEIIEGRKRELLVNAFADMTKLDVRIMRNSLRNGGFPYPD